MTDLKALGGSIGELQLLAQAADGVHNLGLSHACPGALGRVHLPQHHSKGVHIHCVAHATCITPTAFLGCPSNNHNNTNTFQLIMS